MKTGVIPENLMLQASDLQSDAAATVKLVQDYLPAFKPEFRLRPEHAWWTFALPFPPGAQYQFSLHGELGGERQVSARDTRFSESVEWRKFWYLPLEMAAFGDDAVALQQSFHESVKTILAHPTRITEKRGIIWLNYKAEYEDVAGWHSLKGDTYYLGLGIGIPFIGKKTVYSSPPLATPPTP